MYYESSDFLETADSDTLKLIARHIPPNCVAVGNPRRVIRYFDTDRERCSMKYKHIVFDIDGTLIDTEYAVLHPLQETIKGLSGREIPCSELRFALGITGTDALKKLEIKDTSYAIELWDKNMRNYTNTIKVFDGITELLKNLLSLDYEMGIVTSKTREEFTHDFCPFGISHYFKTIICADDTQEHKPNAAPILKYVELSKTDHRKVLYIGDSK